MLIFEQIRARGGAKHTRNIDINHNTDKRGGETESGKLGLGYKQHSEIQTKMFWEKPARH